LKKCGEAEIEKHRGKEKQGKATKQKAEKFESRSRKEKK
jgi:hypothetical protein